jgi:hypothetical protein
VNLYQKIIKVMESIEYLKKDDTVGTGSMSYKAISDEKVKVSIRNSMIKNGLVMFRTKVETEVVSREYEQYNKYNKCNESKIQHFCKVRSTYKIVNAENPEESIEIQSIGHGVDPQDKAAGKAMTYASKYALLDTFLIPTGEDSDKTHSNDIEPPVDRKPKATPAISKGVISSAQVTRLQAIASSHKIAPDEAKEILARYKYTSSKDIKTSDYDKVIADIEELGNTKQGGQQ